MIDLGLAATLVGGFVVALFLGGLVDIGRNGLRGGIRRSTRRARGSKDAGPVLFFACLAAGIVLVSTGAVAIGSDDNGPTLEFSTVPLIEAFTGG